MLRYASMIDYWSWHSQYRLNSGEPKVQQI